VAKVMAAEIGKCMLPVRLRLARFPVTVLYSWHWVCLWFSPLAGRYLFIFGCLLNYSFVCHYCCITVRGMAVCHKWMLLASVLLPVVHRRVCVVVDGVAYLAFCMLQV